MGLCLNLGCCERYKLDRNSQRIVFLATFITVALERQAYIAYNSALLFTTGHEHERH